MFRPIRVDHTNCLQVAIKTHSFIPQFNLLVEASFVWDESSASNADVTVIPSQFKVTKQILLHWQPFRDLKLMFADSRRAEQLSLRSQQRVVATVEESVLKTEMAGLESQEEDAPKRLLRVYFRGYGQHGGGFCLAGPLEVRE